MINIYADLHTHTCVSQHAYSTIDEMLHAAKDKGFVAIAITDHGPEMMDGAISHHFLCMQDLPDLVDGVHLLKGAEVNIKSFDGKLDLKDSLLEPMQFVIASYHTEAIKPGTFEENTLGWLSVIKNPLIDCIGHCGNPAFSCDLEAVVKACKEYGKLVEINSNSFKVRKGSLENCRRVAELCMEYQVPIIVSSDAHAKYFVGEHTAALKLLEEVGFPEALVMNGSKERLAEYFHWDE